MRILATVLTLSSELHFAELATIYSTILRCKEVGGGGKIIERPYRICWIYGSTVNIGATRPSWT